MRRALDQIRGGVRVTGDPDLSSLLARAWRRASRDDADTWTHGFHSWPARMHPSIARVLLESLDPRSVLDPFCGGGTVLVEARASGRASVGVDLDPLARLLCDVKTDQRDEAARARFLTTARAVAMASETRVRQRVPIRVNLPESELRWYGPHVLKELGGLLEEIRSVEDRGDRRGLAMCFSSIVVKVSKQRADTAEQETERRIRKGLATEFFLRKAEELEARWASYAPVAKGPRPKLFEGDARQLPRMVAGRRLELVLTSPPYGGTYDYAGHHARRAAWLRLDRRRLVRHEVGARRRSRRAGTELRWEREVDDTLRSIATVMRPGGTLVLVMGDGEVGGHRIEVIPQLNRLAPRHGLTLVASASQRRKEWRPKERGRRGGRPSSRRPREEHLVALVKRPSRNAD